MWLCILSSKRLEDTFKKAQWGKASQMQPMRLCILTDISFDDTYENTQWRKATQMQPVWLSSKPFDHSSKITQWWKICNQCEYQSHFNRNLKTHTREKPNKCKECKFSSSRADDLKSHVKIHNGEKVNKCNQCNFASNYESN